MLLELLRAALRDLPPPVSQEELRLSPSSSPSSVHLQECGQRFTGGQYFELDGQPFCEHHYHLKRGSICSACRQPVTGRCITALGRKWHPDHFVCTFCLKELNRGTFKERADKPYCHECFVKLFG